MTGCKHYCSVFFLSAVTALGASSITGCIDGKIGSYPGADIGDTPDAGDPQVDAGPQADAFDACMGMPVIDWYLDSDGDGYGDPATGVQSCTPIPDRVTNGDDCDDGRGAVNPGETEICGDALDNDCRGGDPCDLSMIAYWKFDEGSGAIAADSTNRGHDARLNNVGWNGAGTAVSFNGTDGYVEVDHAPDFVIDEGSVALWFRARTVTATQGIWSKDSSGFDTGGHLSISIVYDAANLTNRLQVRIQDVGASYYVEYPNLQAATWYHLVANFGPNGLSLWVNGTLRNNANYSGGLGPSSGGVGNYEPLAMGASTQTSDNFSVLPTNQHLDGLIRDVRVFNRSLVSSEILDIYNNSSL